LSQLILDTHQVPDGQLFEAEVCIVGAGAAGITLCKALIGCGIEVLLLESGGREAETATQDLYAGSVVDERLHSPPDRYRQRRFGGTTTIWGGRCMPFDEIDFEERDYIPDSGWPFAREALLPFYPEANRLCEAGVFEYLAGGAFGGPLRPMLSGFDDRHFSIDTLERFSCPTDFGRRYGHKLEAAANVRVLLHANVTAIELDAAGESVAQLAVRNLQGGKFTVRARRYVLATGGLEVARLLLASRNVQSAGIGNSHDLVGRYYMCHLAGTIGRIEIAGPLANAYHGYDISDEGVYCRRRFALRPETQRARGIGNFVARLHHPRITDPAHRSSILSLLFLMKFLIPYEYGKRLHGGEAASLANWMRHAANVFARPFDALGFAWHMLRDRKLAERKFPSIIVASRANLYSLDFHAEQQPIAASRVLLSDRLDALGMPRLAVDWRYSRGDVETVSRSLALLAEDIKNSGVGTFEYDPAEVEPEMTRYGAYGGHHMGTARMGNDPRSSVVDADCRVHGVRNLFIAGAATFPTSSQANPTLTVVALALRLADHLQKKSHA
jgi:choline dehydrogenase-like flavoprotein